MSALIVSPAGFRKMEVIPLGGPASAGVAYK